MRINNALSDMETLCFLDSCRDLKYLIFEIDSIYECVHTLVCQFYSAEFHQTENMKYFKFIRDILFHPDGVNSKAYKNDTIYAEHTTAPERRVVCRDFANKWCDLFEILKTEDVKNLFENYNKKDCFVLTLGAEYPNFYKLLCPYDKIWKCLEDLFECLCDIFINHEETKIKNNNM